MRKSENQTTEICRSQKPGVDKSSLSSESTQPWTITRLVSRLWQVWRLVLVLKNLRKLLENHSRQATAYRHGGGGLQVEAAGAAAAVEAGLWVAESACPSHDAKTERFVAWGHFSRSIPITFSSTLSSAFYSDGLQWTNGLRQKLLTIAQCNQNLPL